MMNCPHCNSTRYNQIKSDFGNYMLCSDCNYIHYGSIEVKKTETNYIDLKKGDKIRKGDEYFNDRWIKVEKKWIGTICQGDDDTVKFRREL